MVKKIFLGWAIVIVLVVLMTGCNQQDQPKDLTTTLNETSKNNVISEPEIDEIEIIKEQVKAFYDRYPDNKYMATVDQIKDQVDTLFIIDVRPPDSYAKGHLPNASNFPLKQIGSLLTELPEDQTILVICTNGQSAAQTSGILNLAGYNALSLYGGYDAWVAANLPVEN